MYFHHRWAIHIGYSLGGEDFEFPVAESSMSCMHALVRKDANCEQLRGGPWCYMLHVEGYAGCLTGPWGAKNKYSMSECI